MNDDAHLSSSNMRRESRDQRDGQQTDYRLLFQQMDQGFCVIERTSVSGEPADFVWIEANPAFLKQVGRGDLVGQSLAATLSPDVQQAFTTFDQVLRTGEPARFQCPMPNLGTVLEIRASRLGGADSTCLAVLSQDVTEQRRSAAALHENEERFRTLAEAIEDVFYITDLERNRLLYLSPAYDKVWGRDRAGVMESLDSFVETLHPDDRDRFLAGKSEQLRDQPVVTEYRIVRPDGSVRWIFDRSFPIADHGERHAAGVATDVTERREAEEALRDSEERLRLIVGSARDYAIFTTDPKGVIDRWLPGAEAVFGWTRTEAEGMDVAVTFTPEDRAAGQPEKERETALVEGEAPDVRWHVRKDGERVFIEGQAVPLRASGGQVQGFLKIGQDVTERRLAEQALQDSEERFRQFGDASSDLLWIRNAETLAFEYVSPAFEQVYGVSRTAFLEQNHVKGWAELIHPEDRDRALDHLRDLRTGVPSTTEFRVVRSDGHIRWIHNTDFPIFDERGTVQRIAGIAQNVTQQKRAIELQGTLLAELQHRVRNILAMIRSVARRTAHTTHDIDDYVSHLEGRISAMARVQTILTREPGRGVDLRILLLDELEAEAASIRQYRLEGPEVELGPKAAEVFSLAVHELATNSVKYGALSDDHATVSVSWSVDENHGDRRLRFEWNEPFVGEYTQPIRRGFGTELIERRVPYELGGNGKIEISPGGVRATLEFPLTFGRSILETGSA